MNFLNEMTKSELIGKINQCTEEANAKATQVALIEGDKELTDEKVKRAEELTAEYKGLEAQLDLLRKELNERTLRERENAAAVARLAEQTKSSFDKVKEKNGVVDNKSKEYALEFAKAILDRNVDQFVEKKFGKKGFTKSLGTYQNNGLNLNDFSAIIPTYIAEGIERKAVDFGGLLAHSQVESVKGRIQIGVEKSATGANIHGEGTAPVIEEEIELEAKMIVPVMVKKAITWTHELQFSTPEELLNYLVGEFAEKIISKVEFEMINGQIVNGIGYNGIVTEANLVGGSAYVKKTPVTAIDWKTGNRAMGQIRGSNPKWFMNRTTYYENLTTQSDTTNQPIYGTSASVVPTYNGIPVVFTDALKPWDTAVAGEAVMFLAVQNAVKANMPNGIIPKYYIDDTSYAMKTANKTGLVGEIFGCSTPAKLDGIVVITKDVQPI